jgi:NADH-quinone oxidoreductase subunit I
MAIDSEQEVGAQAQPKKKRRAPPGLGLIKGLGITLKHMLQPSITQQYPDEKPDLPARTRGVIALKMENCTVCWKCSRECPDWCIYIESHKETHPPASGGRARSVKVLDRFAIDYSLCMYCGICVEVCPFDALFWSPEFEYAEYDIFNLTHEQDRLEEWTYKVLPPPPLEEGAEPPEEPREEAPAAETPTETGMPPAAEAAGTPVPTAPAPTAAAPAAPAPTAAVAEPPRAAASAPAAPRAPAEHVDPDEETYERVLAEEVAKGTDRRVAEGRAKAAAIRAARKKAGG